MLVIKRFFPTLTFKCFRGMMLKKMSLVRYRAHFLGS